MTDEKVFAMPFARVYPLLVQKAERKGQTKEEVDRLICRMTGYSREQLEEQVKLQVSYQNFFEQAPAMHPACGKIRGSICGIRVHEIQNPLMQKIRRLDKLIDDLAKGKTVEKLLPEE